MRTTDGGRTWTRFTPPPADNSGPPTGQLTVFAAHPNVSGVVFAAIGAGLWRSTDAGQSWQLIYTAGGSDAESQGVITAIGFDHLSPSTVYMAGSDGFRTSNDLGTNWQKKNATNLGGPFQGAFAFSQPRIESDPQGSGALIANASRPYLSRDGGQTWTVLLPTPAQTSSVATFSRTQPGRIYVGAAAGASGSLWVSDNWGQTWSQTKAQPLAAPSGAVIDVFTNPDQPSLLYVLTLGALLVSDDNAASWYRLMPDYLGYQVSRATGCENGSLLVATRDFDQLSFSGDQGQSWQTTAVANVQKFTAGAGCSAYVVRQISGDGFVAMLDQFGAAKWSTYLSGVGLDAVTAINTDQSGNVLVAGTVNRIADILLAKFTSDGRLLWKKVISGSSGDTPFDIAADDAGNIVTGGQTGSDDFPVTTGGARTQASSGFAAKLTADGDVLWARYVDILASSLALEPGGSILFAGTAPTSNRNSLIRVDASGSTVEMLDTIVARPAVVRTDAAGNVYIAGSVLPEDARTNTPGAYVSPVRARSCGSISWGGPITGFGRTDLQVARLRAGTLEPDFSAVLGGECGSSPQSLDIGADGRITLGFLTQAQAFDLRAPFATAGCCQQYDLSTGVAQLSADGTQLLRSSLLDGCSQVRVAATPDAIYTASDNNIDATVLQIEAATEPTVRVDNVVNAFSGTGFGVAPGELIAISGVHLGPAEPIDLEINSLQDLPVELGNTAVLLNGQQIPLLRVSNTQVIAAVPYELSGNSVSVQLSHNGDWSNEVSVRVIASSPALLTAGFPFIDPETAPQANARNFDGTPNGPSNPAKVGDTVWVFATGLGVTNTAVRSGAIARTEALAPTALFRDQHDVPFSYSPLGPAPKPIAIRSMPAFINNIFAGPDCCA